MDLPQNYAHVFADMTCYLEVDTASDFKLVAMLQTQYNFPLAKENKMRYAFDLLLGDIGTDESSQIILKPTNGLLPRAPIWNTTSNAPTVVLTFNNFGAPASAAGKTSCAMSFWQYDLEQVRSFPVNAPVAVASR